MITDPTATTLTVFGALGLLAAGYGAGVIGALVGIGGGIVVVPMLTMGLGVDIRVAVAVSLIAVIASSTASGSVFVGRGLSNLRLGMTLEIGTTIGGISGALLAVVLPERVIAIVFAVSLFTTALLMLRARDPLARANAEPEAASENPSTRSAVEPFEPFEAHGRLAGAYIDEKTGVLHSYEVKRVALGSCLSYVAGVLSGLLGIGGGVIKVPAMNLGMGVPIKVATATSNFMIGITAVSSLFIYFSRGLVHPLLAAPVAAGVTAGAWLGTRLAGRFSSSTLKKTFACFAIVVAIEIAWKTVRGGP